MKRFFQNISLLTALLCSVVVMNSSIVLAAGKPGSGSNPSYAGVQCNGPAGASPVCSASATDPLTGSGGVIVKATNLIALVAGVAAVVMIIVAGIKFITSQGDPGAVGEARKTIIFACVGIAVIVLSRAIIMFVVSRIK